MSDATPTVPTKEAVEQPQSTVDPVETIEHPLQSVSPASEDPQIESTTPNAFTTNLQIDEALTPQLGQMYLDAKPPLTRNESSISLISDDGPNDMLLKTSESNKPTIHATPEEPMLQMGLLHTKGFHNVEETFDRVELETHGQLPSWLNGEFFTVGPGVYDIKYGRKIEVDGQIEMATETFTFGHWFDAIPMLNRFEIAGNNNQIVYRSNIPCHRLISKIRDHHGYAPTHPAGLFKTNPNQSFLAKFIKPSGKAKKPDLEPCGAAVLPSFPSYQEGIFCLNNGAQIQEIDPNDLTPKSVFTWGELNPAFRGSQASPHPVFDPATRELINFTMEVGYSMTQYHFFSVTDKNPHGSLIASVQARASLAHSFAVTKHYIVLVLFPMIANYGGLRYNWADSLLDSFAFRSTEPTLFYVISRVEGAHIATYRADACFSFHHINAFEDEQDNLHLDLVCYETDAIAHQFVTEHLRDPNGMGQRLAMPEIRRYSLTDLHRASELLTRINAATQSKTGSFFRMFKSATSRLTPEQQRAAAREEYGWMPEARDMRATDSTLELPRVNPKFQGRPYKYIYGIGLSPKAATNPGHIWDSIVKADLEYRLMTAMWHEDHCYPSEAVFIPAPPTAVAAAANSNEVQPEDEDAGVLLSVVFDGQSNKSFLLCLDAKNLTELARVYLPRPIPLSFSHGCWKGKQS
ncbi:uncharacterized protein VTP21DRAFT_1227 [Calcarisporiella thermophila]|uniref:uncharacterized protein n=1 Tax=Calcarisporiella thermophila TaxID=911321 RepID=UPI003743C4B7